MNFGVLQKLGIITRFTQSQPKSTATSGMNIVSLTFSAHYFHRLMYRESLGVACESVMAKRAPASVQLPLDQIVSPGAIACSCFADSSGYGAATGSSPVSAPDTLPYSRVLVSAGTGWIAHG